MILEKLYLWLFSEEERTPVSFIIIFFMMILMGFAIALFVVAIDNHVGGWVEYLWGG